jgi:hypothetical protein
MLFPTWLVACSGLHDVAMHISYKRPHWKTWMLISYTRDYESYWGHLPLILSATWSWTKTNSHSWTF